MVNKYATDCDYERAGATDNKRQCAFRVLPTCEPEDGNRNRDQKQGNAGHEYAFGKTWGFSLN